MTMTRVEIEVQHTRAGGDDRSGATSAMIHHRPCDTKNQINKLAATSWARTFLALQSPSKMGGYQKRPLDLRPPSVQNANITRIAFDTKNRLDKLTAVN
eukprot:CAMPEP_0204332948 /NCGR_PEP_ID=MMETSP0469-20131031/16847_1 /ASSEMBLY_ACC=CAM_ASM_000384 /TAXON_ID=2969 /ORGANISM="Oxyrrhis marina" /LENGTH=98 /DNA_ID=CAMNT_0051316197 /DNA_START=4 /DNA_END=301 /DNA_ORIENTATION=+